MPSNNWTVAVTYCADRQGMTRLAYAASLAQQTGSALLALIHCEAKAGFRGLRLDSHGLPEDRVCGFAGHAEAEIAARTAKGEKLIAVVSEEDPLYAGLPCIVSKDEGAVFRNVKREILLPFGPGEAACRVLGSIRELADLLGASIRLYHTTWRAPGVESENAYDHMCAEAREALAKLRESGPFEAALEMAEEVDSGIHLAALKSGSSLIAMTRGSRVLKGGYLAELIARSAVPVIIIPEGRRVQ